MIRKKIILNSIINFDVSEIIDNISHNECKNYVSQNTGEHYRFLAYLSLMEDNKLILDIGTYRGHSALCLGINKNNTVISYDIDSCLDIKDLEKCKNISFVIKNISDIEDEIIKQSEIIMLDIDHNGDKELNFIKRLIKLSYKGLLILDDIYLNNSMINLWEKEIPKLFNNDIIYDLTNVCHLTGTGLIDFSSKYEIIYE